MNTQTTQPETQQPTARILARELARELSKEEVQAISGGRFKLDDVPGTGSGIWGNLDD